MNLESTEEEGCAARDRKAIAAKAGDFVSDVLRRRVRQAEFTEICLSGQDSERMPKKDFAPFMIHEDVPSPTETERTRISSVRS